MQKLWKDAEVIDVCTGITPHWPNTYFFVIIDLVIKLNGSGCAHVSRSRHKCGQERATWPEPQNPASTVELLQ